MNDMNIIYQPTLMWEIFKRKTGKDFYRDSLALYSYMPDEDDNSDYVEDYYMDNDEIAYRVTQKIKKDVNHKNAKNKKVSRMETNLDTLERTN